MNALLLYPEFPDTFWGFKHALKFISKRSANIPLGIITVAALLPEDWDKKLVDLNVRRLKDKHLEWADLVFLSGLSVQCDSVNDIIQRCKEHGVKIVAGGPLFTEEPERFTDVGHMVLNEAEITLPLFLEDLANGKARKIYRTDSFAEMKSSPSPEYSLLELDKYATAGIQYSRGCPYDCEFCDITALFGRKFRTKSTAQVITELNTLHSLGWKGSVFFVDDNFIGNKKRLKNDLLPAMIEWKNHNDHPFVHTTEASIELADDLELMELMVKAGFNTVFVGIETPEEHSLQECKKIQNCQRDLMGSVRIIQAAGMEVSAGFIVGFDNDTPNVFRRQADFIQNSGIISAMVGLLNAPRKSKLYTRLAREGRITDSGSGNNTNYTINFEPVMDRSELIAGYRRLLSEIYSSPNFYKRTKSFLENFDPPVGKRKMVTFAKLRALLRSFFFLGILNRNRFHFWSFISWSLFRKPKMFSMAVTYAIFGYHFRKSYQLG